LDHSVVLLRLGYQASAALCSVPAVTAVTTVTAISAVTAIAIDHYVYFLRYCIDTFVYIISILSAVFTYMPFGLIIFISSDSESGRI